MASRRYHIHSWHGLRTEPLEPRQLLTGSAHRIAAEIQPPRAPSLFVEPEAGRDVILQAIASAQREIRLGICNLSDPTIAQALADAVGRGVKVRVVVDQADYAAKPPEQQVLAQLAAEGVAVHASNRIFAQSFEKELVIDQRTVLIMTMCLVPQTFEDTRDIGLVLRSPIIVHEVSRVFDNDWAFSAPPGIAAPPYNPTPPLRVASLIWGPIDAEAKLTRLIQQARHTIDATTELLDDPNLESELIAAEKRGVRVRLILPVEPRETFSNDPGIALLASQGAAVRVTIGRNPPASTPYMHAKTMIVDDRAAYLGSIDLETAAATRSRELGVLFRQRSLISQLNAQFQVDWALAVPVPR